MPDPEFYAQCIEDSFTELRDAARAAPANRQPVAHKPAKAKAAAKKPTVKPKKAAKKK